MKQLEQVIIGRYQIQSHIAQGGMANIYLAYDGEKDQTVAISQSRQLFLIPRSLPRSKMSFFAP